MVQGVAALHARFQAVPKKVRVEVAKQLEKEAEKLVREMRAIAPKRSGDLASAIRWTWGEAPAGSLVLARSRGGQDFGKVAITVYVAAGGDAVPDAFYARFQEFGTIHMPANPFFFPVYRANKRRIRSNLTRAVKRAIQRS